MERRRGGGDVGWGGVGGSEGGQSVGLGSQLGGGSTGSITGSVGDGVAVIVPGVGGWVGCGQVGRLGVSSEGGRRAMSSKIDLCSLGGNTGVYFLRNFLFLRVGLPDPSMRTRYWWY